MEIKRRKKDIDKDRNEKRTEAENARKTSLKTKKNPFETALIHIPSAAPPKTPTWHPPSSTPTPRPQILSVHQGVGEGLRVHASPSPLLPLPSYYLALDHVCVLQMCADTSAINRRENGKVVIKEKKKERFKKVL